ncbi:hypothetical protein [Roseivirga sp.]|uniref:hypothetical protein n=1 Tax=Roseivirga sp. TaxID=1964215 RepID=UPI003BAA7CBF
MKKGKGIAVILIVLVGVIYLAPYKKSSADNIKLILPETSLMTFRLDNPNTFSNLISSKPWFKPIQKIPLVQLLVQEVAAVNALNENGSLTSKLAELTTWISLHTTASDELSPLFIIKSEGFDWETGRIKNVLELLANQEFATSEQEFDGKLITLFKSQDLSLATLIEGAYLVIAENSILVEDVVRAIQDEESRLLGQTEKLSSKEVLTIILNTERLKEFSSVFFKERSSNAAIFGLKGNIIIDAKVSDEGLTFSGQSLRLNDTETTPTEIFGKNFIPEVASSFSWKPNKVEYPELADAIGNGYAQINLGTASDQQNVYLLPLKDSTTVSNVFSKMAESLMQEGDSAVYKERFITSDIGYINDKQTTGRLIQSLSKISSAPFYAIQQNLLLISENLDALKSVLNDFDNESTWGRTIERRRILDDIVQETDFTFIQDFEFASDPIKNSLKPNWVIFFEENPELLDVLELFKVQVNATKKSMLVSGDLDFRENYQTQITNVDQTINENDIIANVFADSEIVTKPFVVRNHNNSSLEVIFQDSRNNLYLTNKEGEVLWKKQLPNSISGDIHQIDYYKNRKLQYLFFADSSIYLVDRNGTNVDGFPVKTTANQPITGSEIIDYASNKEYRYLSEDRRGNVTLHNKQGEVLDGWAPRVFGSPLLQTPFHLRIRGRDCFIAVETSGTIHLTNRKGEAYAGFPLKIDGRFAGDIVLQRGANFEQTFVSVMTESGEFVKANLNGQIISQKQFVRPSVNTSFSLIDDALKSDYAVVRNDGRVLTFFDSKHDPSFSIDYPNSRNISIDFYNFRNGKEVFVIRDIKENVMRIVDRNGEFLTPIIQNSGRISVLFYQNRLEYEVFVKFANQMNVYAVKPI